MQKTSKHIRRQALKASSDSKGLTIIWVEPRDIRPITGRGIFLLLQCDERGVIIEVYSGYDKRKALYQGNLIWVLKKL